MSFPFRLKALSVSSASAKSSHHRSRCLRLSPVFAALLIAYPALSQQVPGPSDAPSLPDLAQAPASSVRLRPGSNGVDLDANDAASRLTVSSQSSQRTGLSLGARGAFALGDVSALGGGLQLGANSSEIFVNLGMGLGDTQRLLFSGGQLRQKLDFVFPSGVSRAELTQNSLGASWRFNLGSGLLDYAEASAYAARTASRDLDDVAYAVDTSALYELWNDPRRIAGGTLAGFQGKLGLRPWTGGRVSFGLGQENLRYDLLGGAENHHRATGNFGLEHALDARTRLKFGVDSGAAQGRVSLGFDHRFGDLGSLGIEITALTARDGAPHDGRVQVSWNLPLGKGTAGAGASGVEGSRIPRPEAPQADRPAGAATDGLLDQVAARPGWMPSQVIAKLDTSAAPTRLIAVDKTALPAGSTINAATGSITTPLGIAVTGIAGVTRNGGAFLNSGQFALSGNNLVINPGLIAQPAVGVTDTYVVTINNAGGGTTLATVTVSHGSVKIDSVVISAGAPAPAVPTAGAVSITGTAMVGQTLTGHYTYADINGDAEGTSTFRWLRDGSAIGGATAITYTLVAADQGHAVSFEVTPVSTESPTTGTAVSSTATAPVAFAPAVPTAGAVGITGTAQVGETLTGHYTYADVNGDPEGVSTFRWLRDGSAISGATARTYVLVAADQGHTISFEVTPVSTESPTDGTPAVSAATTSVAGVGVPAAPTAGAVDIGGTVQVGETLTGHYTYADANNDPEGVSTFRWLRDGVAISGATAGTYTLVAADQGHAIRFEVTPVSTVAPTTGTPTLSAATVSVAGVGEPAAPTASTLSITGSAVVGHVLTGHYTYADANNDPEGTSVFAWLRDGSVISGATSITYTLVAADQGHAISFRVTPVSTATPTTGTPTLSAATASVIAAPAAPTASSVSIGGSTRVGQTLTGSYTYADVNGDPEGTSTFRWLRNGSPISGATAKTYVVTEGDMGTQIRFEVTPVSTVSPTTGTAVSSASLAVPDYIVSGGLTWMPISFVDNWNNASSYCASYNGQGQSDWRLPTKDELLALADAGTVGGAQGWRVGYTWSDTLQQTGVHYAVYPVVAAGGPAVIGSFNSNFYNVSCVR